MHGQTAKFGKTMFNRHFLKIYSSDLAEIYTGARSKCPISMMKYMAISLIPNLSKVGRDVHQPKSVTEGTRYRLRAIDPYHLLYQMLAPIKGMRSTPTFDQYEVVEYILFNYGKLKNMGNNNLEHIS